MSTLIAVIADTHLNALEGTAQDAGLAWALRELGNLKPDVVVVAGDVTAVGDPGAAARFRHALQASGLPFIITVGNSDLRQASDQARVREILKTPRSARTNGVLVVTADSSDGRLSQSERDALEAARRGALRDPFVLVTHYPPTSMDDDSREWLRGWIEQGGAELVISGHKHRDEETSVGAAVAHTVRGLDPDKAIGGPPAVALFARERGHWQRNELRFEAGTASQWPQAERDEFVDWLGISCMGETIESLQLATEERVGCVELRAGAADTPRRLLENRLSEWRRAGGSLLSWHMPDAHWDTEVGAVTNAESWRQSLDTALGLGAQRLTVHVPRAPVGAMAPGSDTWRGMSDFLCEQLSGAAARGTIIGIENMHMNPGEMPDRNRRFGYLPKECLAWIAELRGRLGRESVGMLLDLGHARNNVPFSGQFTLGVWYALVGKDVVGYHVHQVVQTASGMRNHEPMQSLYGPLISCGSFLWAWHTGQIARGPIFLEIRDPHWRRDTLVALRTAVATGCVGQQRAR